MHVREIFSLRRGRIASGIFENYALPGKRGRANGHDSFEKLISCGNPRNSHVINPWHTDSFSSARWERSADRSVELDAGIEVKAHMQYGRKLARSASQVRLFDRISLGRRKEPPEKRSIFIRDPPFTIEIFSHKLSVDSRENRGILIGYLNNLHFCLNVCMYICTRRKHIFFVLTNAYAYN